jgi:hypothetical protein
MKHRAPAATCLLCAAAAAHAARAAPVKDPVAAAVAPLPPQLREGAAVIRWNEKGSYDSVRKGTNSLVCYRVVPGEAKDDARCYHKDMFPLLARARVLAATGVKGADLFKHIDDEVKAGALALPRSPTLGYRVLDGVVWESVHVPYASAEQLGAVDEHALTEAEQKRVPYAMAAGTWWAHIMIEHPPR